MAKNHRKLSGNFFFTQIMNAPLLYTYKKFSTFSTDKNICKATTTVVTAPMLFLVPRYQLNAVKHQDTQGD